MKSAIVIGLIACWLASTAIAASRYVNVNNPTPAAPFTNWAAAAVTIQDAVDAAQAGDTVLVTNGINILPGMRDMSFFKKLFETKPKGSFIGTSDGRI